MIKGILHQVEDKMGMNAVDIKNSNQGLSRQLIHTYIHTHKLRHIITKN